MELPRFSHNPEFTDPEFTIRNYWNTGLNGYHLDVDRNELIQVIRSHHLPFPSHFEFGISDIQNASVPQESFVNGRYVAQIPVDSAITYADSLIKSGFAEEERSDLIERKLGLFTYAAVRDLEMFEALMKLGNKVRKEKFVMGASGIVGGNIALLSDSLPYQAQIGLAVGGTLAYILAFKFDFNHHGRVTRLSEKYINEILEIIGNPDVVAAWAKPFTITQLAGT